MQAFSFDDWQRWRQQGNAWLPAAAVRRDEALPVSWEALVREPAAVLLESAQGGRYTYLCDRPERVVVGEAEGARIRDGASGATLAFQKGKPLDVLAALLAGRRVPALPGWPAMTGGLIGVFGYDLVHTWEHLPRSARRDLPLPLYAMIEPRELFVYDHRERTLGVLVWRDVSTADLAATYREARSAAERALERWRAPGAPVGPASRPGSGVWRASQVPAPAAGPSFDSAGFHEAVRRIQDYIAAGHTYQVNLSLRTSRPTSLGPEQIYEALRRVNPSPYMGLLRLPEWALVCGSPELLVKVVDGTVSSRPIAGTRRRGDDAPQDSHLSAELLANEKERAEHLMLVDLIRNDIGRIAAYGSVHVPEFMVLEHYSHVMHIVSQVEGRLADGRTWADVLRSMFPGGTITGCPKVRTMEIIEELEPVGRGFYTGALGWISYAGAMEMNIIIRSMLVMDGVAHVQAGAGIVADSRPERELDESLRKAQALWVALDVATQLHG